MVKDKMFYLTLRRTTFFALLTSRIVILFLYNFNNSNLLV